MSTNRANRFQHTALPLNEARHIADALDRAHRSTAIFVNDQGHLVLWLETHPTGRAKLGILARGEILRRRPPQCPFEKEARSASGRAYYFRSIQPRPPWQPIRYLSYEDARLG